MTWQPTPSERLALALESKVSVTTVYRIYKRPEKALPVTLAALRRAARKLKLPPPPEGCSEAQKGQEGGANE